MTILLLALASALLSYGIWELSPNTATLVIGAVRNAIGFPRTGAVTAPLPRVHDLPSQESSSTDQEWQSAVFPWARSRILTLWLPLAIVGVGFALRTIDLSVDPHGFFCDEASNGLDAYLIGHTLHNRQHVLLPVFFQALDDWRGGFHIYWDVPFMMVFGLTVFATRLGSAVAGTLTVWLTYLFVGKAVNRPVGLLSALLLATTPWHLLTSRMGFEFVSLPFDVALCLTFLYYGLERPRLLPLAFVFGSLGMYTYQPARIFVPLLCLAWIVLYNQELRRYRRYSIIGIVAGAIILIPVPIAIHDGTFTARLSQLQGPSKPLSAQLSTTWANYLAHFQPSFLFDTSTDWITRHYVHGFGMLYGVEAPFLILGVIMMIVRHRRSDLLFLWWFLIYPIATAVVSPPISTRSIDGVIVFQIAVAIGIFTVAQVLIRAVAHLRSVRFASLAVGLPVVVLVLAGVTITTGQFMNAYFNEYPKYSSGWSGWQSGAGDIASYFAQNHQHYSSLLENAEFNAPDVLLAFYTTPHPEACAACGIVNLDDRNVMQVYYQRNRPELWAVSPDAFIHSPLVSVKHRIVHRLRYPDGTVSFLFVATGPGA